MEVNMTKSNKPIFSDVVVSEIMTLSPVKLKRVLKNMGTVLKVMEKHNVRILPHSANNDLDLDELEEKEPNTKDRKLQVDMMFQ